jgi:hypothetical protein
MKVKTEKSEEKNGKWREEKNKITRIRKGRRRKEKFLWSEEIHRKIKQEKEKEIRSMRK